MTYKKGDKIVLTSQFWSDAPRGAKGEVVEEIDKWGFIQIKVNGRLLSSRPDEIRLC